MLPTSQAILKLPSAGALLGGERRTVGTVGPRAAHIAGGLAPTDDVTAVRRADDVQEAVAVARRLLRRPCRVAVGIESLRVHAVIVRAAGRCLLQGPHDNP